MQQFGARAGCPRLIVDLNRLHHAVRPEEEVYARVGHLRGKPVGESRAQPLCGFFEGMLPRHGARRSSS